VKERSHMHVQESIEIAAPPEEIWSFMADPKRVLEWYFPWEEFEYTGDQQGGPGAALYFQERMGIRSVGLYCVVTDWVEQETIAFMMTEGPLLKRYAERWALEATPAGSRFTLALEAEFQGRIIDALVGPIAQRGSAANVEKMLTGLKFLAEGQVAPD
jgi:uncharacterized protein YndB with AHSA1/START domain